ncbi:MAG: pilus assembly protein TadG-related protein, partial [Roseibium sp.]
MFIFLVVVAGAAIDISRAVSAREKLSYAIDAAALSVATDLSTTLLSNDQITKKIEDSFKANLTDAEFLDKALENLNFVIDSENGTITVSSSATLDNYFIDVGGYGVEAFGPDKFAFGTSAQVSYSRFDVELAMVLDVTGSMRHDMNTLKEASKELLDILIPAGTSVADSKVKMSIVPYSKGVNLGSDASTVTNGTALDNCVTERLEPGKYSDDAYNYNVAKEDDDPVVTYYFGGGSEGCSNSKLLPLTANRTEIKNAISALSATGATAGQTGIGWGWYTLSPNWANLWTGSSAAEPYTNDDVLKFAIIMTDGDFNRVYDYEYKDETCTNGRWEKKTEWYWNGWRWKKRKVNAWVEDCVPNYKWKENESYGYNGPAAKRARDLCDAINKTKIQVFSIYFKTTGSAYGEDLMEYCASSDEHFYNADNKQELIQAFSNIAKKIQQIYLSK